MSNRPDKCRWCGLHEVDDGTLDTVFACGSSWRCRDMWFQSTGCEKIVELRKRVAAAIEALKTIDRYSIEGVYDFGAIGKYDYGGDWVHFEDLDAVRDILQGNNPEIPEGSANLENEQ